MTPQRIRLSRAKGFNLQAASLALNGLPAVNVARPGKWGNPFDFRRSDYCWIALAFGCKADRAGRQEASVRAYREWIVPAKGERVAEIELQVKLGDVPIGAKMSAGLAPARAEIIAALKGKNLACWCAPGAPCHADVLLDIANGGAKP